MRIKSPDTLAVKKNNRIWHEVAVEEDEEEERRRINHRTAFWGIPRPGDGE